MKKFITKNAKALIIAVVAVLVVGAVVFAQTDYFKGSLRSENGEILGGKTAGCLSCQNQAIKCKQRARTSDDRKSCDDQWDAGKCELKCRGRGN
jgi:hypothetical protein